ncbi:hypothetical protein Pcinc_000583 [Petrolisthes cinctipes]|uniref:Retroviral polymerase SH3-like domain-containing protein n=1 Tax=Petrolisthes cinctipes TaxID=88211 RepID=A0AAE1L6E4_PETCI|nr:hypothetical protein Pcinc_000583 [Petrolisthes cinctipes]
MTDLGATGYGPRSRLLFNGDEEKYELWEVKFMGHLRLQKLHENGTAERSWRTLFEMARCMLLEAKLPKKLWTYALRTAAYIRNRCYNPRTGKTPFEMMTGEKPNLKNMKIFGSLCYAYVQEKKKLDARCERGVFVGYDNQSPAYLVYLPEQDNIKRVRCVKFSQEQELTNDAVEEYARPVPETEDKHSEEDEEDHNIKEERGENQDTKQERVSKEGREERRYPERLRTKPGHLEDYILDDDDEVSAAKYYRLITAIALLTFQGHMRKLFHHPSIN